MISLADGLCVIKDITLDNMHGISGICLEGKYRSLVVSLTGY